MSYELQQDTPFQFVIKNKLLVGCAKNHLEITDLRLFTLLSLTRL